MQQNFIKGKKTLRLLERRQKQCWKIIEGDNIKNANFQENSEPIDRHLNVNALEFVPRCDQIEINMKKSSEDISNNSSAQIPGPDYISHIVNNSNKLNQNFL